MRHKTSGYFLLSALLVSLILGLCILLNLRCPQAVSDDALTQEQLTRGVTLTGWQQTGPGHWRFAFEAPADVPELVLCLSTRLLDAVPEGLEPTDQRGEAFWVRPVPGRTSEITVTSTTVPQMWLMLPDTLWHWRELRSSLQLMALVALPAWVRAFWRCSASSPSMNWEFSCCIWASCSVGGWLCCSRPGRPAHCSGS